MAPGGPLVWDENWVGGSGDVVCGLVRTPDLKLDAGASSFGRYGHRFRVSSGVEYLKDDPSACSVDGVQTRRCSSTCAVSLNTGDSGSIRPVSSTPERDSLTCRRLMARHCGGRRESGPVMLVG
jgi:hypothetical protein